MDLVWLPLKDTQPGHCLRLFKGIDFDSSRSLLCKVLLIWALPFSVSRIFGKQWASALQGLLVGMKFDFESVRSRRQAWVEICSLVQLLE